MPVDARQLQPQRCRREEPQADEQDDRAADERRAPVALPPRRAPRRWARWRAPAASLRPSASWSCRPSRASRPSVAVSFGRHRTWSRRANGPSPRIARPVGASGGRTLAMTGATAREAIGGPRPWDCGDRSHRRFGLLLAPRRRARDQGRYAVRRAVRLGLPGRGLRPAGRVPAASRPPAHDPAAQDQLPRQRLGAALAGRQGRHLAVRCGLAAAAGQARRLRGLRPVRRPHDRPGRHLLRRSDRDPSVLGRDVRPGPPPARHRHHPRPRHRGPRAGDRRRHQRAAVLDQVRVDLVHQRRLGGHQHDPVPRGVAVPRARDGGRQHQPHHRLRRRASSRGPMRSTR